MVQTSETLNPTVSAQRSANGPMSCLLQSCLAAAALLETVLKPYSLKCVIPLAPVQDSISSLVTKILERKGSLVLCLDLKPEYEEKVFNIQIAITKIKKKLTKSCLQKHLTLRKCDGNDAVT